MAILVWGWGVGHQPIYSYSGLVRLFKVWNCCRSKTTQDGKLKFARQVANYLKLFSTKFQVPTVKTLAVTALLVFGFFPKPKYQRFELEILGKTANSVFSKK